MNWRHTHAIYFAGDTDETDSFMILPKKQVVQMFFLFPSFTEYKIQNLCAQITPDLLYITKHLFPHQTENFVHFEMLFYQWFFTCICVFIISHSHSAISNPIQFYLFAICLSVGQNR